MRSLVASSLATGESVLSKDEREMGVVLVEIGGGATTVSVFEQGRLCNAVVLPVGGYQFTTDLSVALNSPFDIAEEVKLRFGHVIPEEIGGEQVQVEAFAIAAPSRWSGGRSAATCMTAPRRSCAWPR